MSAVKKEEVFMTSEEMLERSSSWTLACDNALLNRLKRFSEELTRNSQEILRECDTLSTSVTQLDYRLINVSNEFLMLSNTQFVENRVEEFEEFGSSVSSTSVTTFQKTKAEKEAALLNKMKQAIHLGLAACNERRQRDEPSVNQFKMKQPYLIGSPKFFSSKYCGLVDETRRVLPSYQDSIDMDSISIGNNEVKPPTVVTAQEKPEVKFTMPPTPVFPSKVPGTLGQNQNISGENFLGHQENAIPPRLDVPPSPTISNRSSELGAGGGSGSSVSREHIMPHSITDELNKIYGSFAPPPTGDVDSDDDFRPSAGVGRLFDDDDDDDIFGEKELFPPNSKKTDFFGRSNLSQPPAPVFSVPPPIEPVPQSKPVMTAASDEQTVVGRKPATNNIPNPNASRMTDNIPNTNVSVRSGPPPEAEGPSRPKLPPGAVSLFGSQPPPVFNNGTLQAAQTANIGNPSLVAKPDTQISSQSSVGTRVAPTFSKDSVVVPSQTREDVNHTSATSLPSHNATTAPGRTRNIISQGSLSSSGATTRKPKTPQSVPASSLFLDESSDEDIFVSSKKQQIVSTKDAIREEPKVTPAIVSFPKSTVPVFVKPAPSKQVEKVRAQKKSIFDDSESEDDLFSSKPSVSRVESKKKTTATSNNSIFKKDSAQVFAPKPPEKINNSKSLFGDDSDSDTDIFGNKKKVQVKPSAFPSSPKVFSKMEDVQTESALEKEDLFKETDQQQSRKQSIEAIENNNNNNDDETIVESTASAKPVIQSSSSESITSAKPASTSSQNFPKPEQLPAKANVKKSIFDDSESDDDLFSSSGKSGAPNKLDSKADSLFEQKRSLPTTKVVKDKTKRSSLFEDDSDSDGDLFTSKAKKSEPEKSKTLENNGSSENQLSEQTSVIVNERTGTIEDGLDGACNTQISDKAEGESHASMEVKQDIPNSCDGTKQVDEPKSTKVLGNKISEKIKAMQTAKIIAEKSDDSEIGTVSSSNKSMKGKVSVKNLALNLNINPLALKVGAKPPKVGGSTPSTPDRDGNEAPAMSEANATSSNNASAVSSPDKPTVEEIVKINSKDSIEDKNNCMDDDDSKKITPLMKEKTLGVDELVGILKARVKIQKKRRPPSRNFLKSLAVQVESDANEPAEEERSSVEKEEAESKSETTDEEDKINVKTKLLEEETGEKKEEEETETETD